LRNWLVSNGIPIVVAVVFAFAVTAVMARQGPPPIEVRTPELLPTPTAVMYVHVDGAVAVPGVYALASGGRVFEAIDAAGGATGEADTSSLNLAAKVADGQKLVVPIRHAPGESPTTAVAPAQPAKSAPAEATAPGATININSASQKMLESLPGVGPVTATKILTRRDSVGPFTRIDQLKDEKIVNASTFERIKARISAD
jgi:competence protein ComEA